MLGSEPLSSGLTWCYMLLSRDTYRPGRQMSEMFRPGLTFTWVDPFCHELSGRQIMKIKRHIRVCLREMTLWCVSPSPVEFQCRPIDGMNPLLGCFQEYGCTWLGLTRFSSERHVLKDKPMPGFFRHALKNTPLKNAAMMFQTVLQSSQGI